VTAEKFRSVALSIPGASESAHMGHPDFRLGGRIFATLGYPDEKHGMIKLTPEQQRKFVKNAPEVFSPCNGVWGLREATAVHLASAKVGLIRAALDEARQKAPKK
jgi:YjbR